MKKYSQPTYVLIFLLAILTIVVACCKTAETRMLPTPLPPPFVNDGIMKILTSRELDTGDNQIHGFTYYNGMLWGATRTSPGRILRIDPLTFRYDRVVLDFGLDDAEDLIGANGFIWVILYTAPARIVRIDPNTLSWKVVVSFKRGELDYGGSLKFFANYLWAGGIPGTIAKIDPNTFHYQLYNYSNTVWNSQFHALAIGGGNIWASAPQNRSSAAAENSQSILIKVDPYRPSNYSAVNIDGVITDDMAYFGDHLYMGSETSPYFVYKVSNDMACYSANATGTTCYGIAEGYGHIWGVFVGSPGKVVEFDSDLNVITAYTLPSDFNDANEIAFDQNGNAYVTCFESPAKIIKLSCR